MSATGVRNLDRAVHNTSEWLNDLDGTFGWGDKQKTYRACRAVFHVLRDRLPIEEAVQLGAQLPMVLRGLYYEGWRPSDTPAKIRSEEEFLEAVTSAYGAPDPIEPTKIVNHVFSMLDTHVSAGEIDDVKSSLPKPIRRLWPSE